MLPISLPSDGSGSSAPQHPPSSKAMPTPVSEPSTASQDSDAPSKPGDKTESPKSGGHSGAVAATGAAKQHHRKDTALELTSETYNGAVMDNYRWAQTITDLEIRIPVSDEVTAKDVKVEIRNDPSLSCPNRVCTCSLVSSHSFLRLCLSYGLENEITYLCVLWGLCQSAEYSYSTPPSLPSFPPSLPLSLSSLPSLPPSRW